MSAGSKGTRQQDPPFSDPVTVVVETPKGCRQGYRLDEQIGRMKLSARLVNPLAAHLVYGATTELVRRAVRAVC